jgi:hypothetical protein
MIIPKTQIKYANELSDILGYEQLELFLSRIDYLSKEYGTDFLDVLATYGTYAQMTDIKKLINLIGDVLDESKK